MFMNNVLEEIIKRKKEGTDCTEEESAIIKSFLRDFFPLPGNGEVEIISEIQELFPLEYGEILDEWDNLDSGKKHEIIRNSFQ